jgi:hypothetical protein
MTYEPGDLVYPADLPRRVLCRVLRAECIHIGGSPHQMLRLEPLEGQHWHQGLSLIRRGDMVLPARLGDLWRAGRQFRPPPEHPAFRRVPDPVAARRLPR